MTSLDRRSVLRLGATAVAAASAGCLVDGETDEDPFAEWIPAASDGILTAHVDLEVSDAATEETDLLPLILPSRDEEDGPAYVPRISGLAAIDDPLLTVPIGLGGRVLAATIGLYAAGLGYLVDPQRSTPGASDLVFVNGVVGVAGDLDLERARERLTGGTDGMVFHDPFQRTGEYGGYDLYAPTTDVGEAVVALDGSAVLMADTRGELEPVVDAARGEVDRAIDDRDRFGWLVDEAGGGHFTVGWIGERDVEELFWGNAEDQLPVDFVARHDALFTSMTLDPESGESTAELAAAGIDGEAGRERLEGRLGTATEDLELSVAEDRVSASATYGSDALDVEFRERGDGDGADGDEVDPDEDPPPAVAEAVPEDAFRFEFVEAEHRVDVHLERSFQADELTVRTLESEWSGSMSPVDAVDRLSVYVHPEGDTVVVSVTVDGESGVVAVREFE